MDKIRKEVEERFAKDFHYMPLQLLEKVYPHGQLLEHIIYPYNYDFENEEEPLYPMWYTLFQASDRILGDILKRKIDELDEIGIHLMEVEETEAMMFICGAGYDFYEFHWIPLYTKVLKWV